MGASTEAPSVFQELLKRGPANATQARNGAKRNALRHHLKDLGALLGAQPVHTDHYA